MKKVWTVYYLPLLILILAFAFFTRIIRIHIPEGYVFDEVYHAITAKLISRGDPQAFEWWNPPVEPNTSVDWLHPPLAKYTQALAILILGENSFGWRLSSVIFGVLVIAAVAKLSLILFEDEKVSLLAALLAALDGLLLVQSRVAMNDIHVTFFILLTLIYYQLRIKLNSKKYLILAIIAAGLAMSTKWSGLFVLVFIFTYEVYLQLTNLNKVNKNRVKSLITLIKKILLLTLLPLLIYISSYGVMFLQGKTLICQENQAIQGKCYYEVFKLKDLTVYQGYVSHFVELHRQIFWYQTSLKATHSYQSRPWQWFLDSRPVWFYVERPDTNLVANIYSFGNPILFWLGDIFIVVSILIIFFEGLQILTKQLPLLNKIKLQLIFIEKTKLIKINLSSLIYLLTAYLIVWLPWQFSPRIMFFYHYTPAVPLLSIILAYYLIKISKVKVKKCKLGLYISLLSLALIFTTFILWYPHWTAIPMPKWWVDNLYFYFSNWQ